MKFVMGIKMYMCFVNNERGKELSLIWDKRMKKLIENKKILELFKKYNMMNEYSF